VATDQPADRPTDQRIVLAMAELLRVQGYAATGIKQVADAARAPIGSVYHHFKGGKAEIAARALREAGAAYIQLLPLLLDPYDDLVTGVEAAFAAAAEDLEQTGWGNLCPVGSVAAEVAETQPALRAVADGVVTSWTEQITRYLQARGLAEDDARSAGQALLSALEGAFVLARVQRSQEPLLASGRAVAAYVASLPVGVGSR
jgi:AcrR family transcriptional regulator